MSSQSRKPFSEYGDLLMIPDLCKMLGQSRNTVQLMCRTHELPALKIGRYWYVPKEKMIEYIMKGAE